ncbi:hypothetical protein LLE49_14270 [Alicyclobacillus tolerans]|uniref:hypothetical protein n=1 Tax=Alicyclobacillus tolerans TaxID=90970 RepID=UPI001F2B7EE3|nr:hypothetical protein [Alicyclobacillus tolerans]MCF8565887.1 hypothetical protein [Alicyclobacillus tolerans]
MKFDTLIKLGSLAFGVAQDDKVQELFKMAHKGAKRRGIFNPSTGAPRHDAHGPIPFRPGPSHHRFPFY